MFLSRLIIILLASTVLSQTVIYKYTKEQQATYASFAAYLTAAGTTLTSFEVGKDIPIISTTRIQNTLDVRAFTSGAKFTGTSTLYIGKMSAKPEAQIFDTALTVYFDSGSVSEVYTHWWGNSRAAFRRANNAAALNGIPLVISKYSYPIAGKITTSASLDISNVLNSGKVKGNTGSAVDTLVIGRMTSVPTHQWIDTSITVQFASGAIPAVRPEWRGAKGDSVTNSSAAWQWALNTGLPVEGAGIYYCPTTLTVTSINIDSKTGFTFKGNSSAALFTCTTNKIKLNGVTIRNYTRVFERTVDQTPPPALDIEMQNCTVDSLTTGIFYFGDKTFNTSRAKINNNNFNNYANGILLYCNNYARNVDISNNIFTNAKRSTNNLSAIRIQTNLGSVSVPDTNTQDSSKCINICENIIDSIIGGNSSAGGYITGIMVLASRANIIGNVIKTVKNGYPGSIATSGNGYGIYTKLYDGIISDNNLWDAGSFAGITCKSEMLLSQSGYNDNGKSGRLTVSENKIHYEKITPTDNVSMRVHAENSIVADNTMTGRNAVLLLDSGEPNLPNNNNIVSGNLLISDSLVLMAVESDKTKIVDNMLRYNGAGVMKSPSDPGSVTEHVNRMLVFGCETSVKAVNHTYRDMEVSGNSISYDGAGSIFGIVGMEIEADTINYKNIKINNNLFYGIQYPIYLKNKYARWDSVAIHDNKIFTIVGTGTQLGYDSLSHISDVYVHDNYGMGASFSKKQTFSTTTTGVNRYVTLDSAGNFLWSAGLETAGQNMLMRSGNTLNIRTLRDSLNSFVYIMPKMYPSSGNTQIGLFSTDYQLDGTNYEALFINKGIGGPVQFKADKGGTGSYRNIELYTKNIRRALIDTNGLVSVDSSLWCGKNLRVADSAHAVNVVKTFRLRTDSVIVGANRVVSSRGAALTPQLTSITHTEPGTPDYAIQDMTQTVPWGYASQDEANSVLKVILNLQTRVAELEARLKATGGHGLIAD